MRSITIVVLTALLTLTAPPYAGVFATAGDGRSADELPTVDEILERYYEALGGRESLERIKTRVSTGRVVDDRPYTGPVHISTFEGYGREDGQWAYVEHASDGEFAEGWSGAVSWKLEDGEVTMSEKRDRSNMAFVLDPQGPLHIRDYFGDMTLTGITEYEGRSVYAVETDRAAQYYTLYFDVESGLLTNIGYHWYIKDYRTIDGALVPHRIITGRKGGSVTHAFDEIVTNTPVAGGRFEPRDDGTRSH